jgi:hypothetical protein
MPLTEEQQARLAESRRQAAQRSQQSDGSRTATSALAEEKVGPSLPSHATTPTYTIFFAFVMIVPDQSPDGGDCRAAKHPR